MDYASAAYPLIDEYNYVICIAYIGIVGFLWMPVILL